MVDLWLGQLLAPSAAGHPGLGSGHLHLLNHRHDIRWFSLDSIRQLVSLGTLLKADPGAITAKNNPRYERKSLNAVCRL